MDAKRPLVFACAGCSPSGQLAYLLALELERRGIAEMSCLAGIGAGKSHFLKKLKDRKAWIIDGCAIECALGIFGNVGEHVDVHIRLHDFGVRKQDPVPTGEKFAAFVDRAIAYIESKQSVLPQGSPLSQAG